MIARLLKVEHTEEPTEIVIHVNMLKEGWDVKNVYVIASMRASMRSWSSISRSVSRSSRARSVP